VLVYSIVHCNKQEMLLKIQVFGKHLTVFWKINCSPVCMVSYLEELKLHQHHSENQSLQKLFLLVFLLFYSKEALVMNRSTFFRSCLFLQ